ncbi:VOC family protein [Vannielia litorea]|uniref:VOC family protein n=1 Tax=Vannielia litorea TaxID=1217970 RepID=UPI001BCC3505|nr:VOC family protein [Vannielia litorea]MBS8229052.1 VOC family protein [Vannielia litorea]
MSAQLEHVNVTVSDLDRALSMLHDLFGWELRWRGSSIYGGETAHVGGKDSYLALYRHHDQQAAQQSTYHVTGGLNHVGVVVDDLDAVEQRVKDYGLKPRSHADYEPGRRFYFEDWDGVEYEVISYA